MSENPCTEINDACSINFAPRPMPPVGCGHRLALGYGVTLTNICIHDRCIIPLCDKRSPEPVSQSRASSQRGSNSESPFLSNVVGLVEIQELDFGDSSIEAVTELGKQLDVFRDSC